MAEDQDPTHTTPSAPDAHQDMGEGEALVPGGRRRTISIVGSWSEMETAIRALRVGCVVGDATVPGLPDGYDAYPVAGASLQRMPGGRARALVTFSIADEVHFFNLEMACISKDILTWRQDDDEHPDLANISAWRALEGSEPTLYAAFKYYDGSGDEQTLSGLDLALAKMIAQGVTSYTIHAPVVNCSTLYDHYPSGAGSALDMRYEAAGLVSEFNGETAAGDAGSGVYANLFNLAAEWLMTGDRVVCNADGTFTRLRQWTGADRINPELYESASGEE